MHFIGTFGLCLALICSVGLGFVHGQNDYDDFSDSESEADETFNEELDSFLDDLFGGEATTQSARSDDPAAAAADDGVNNANNSANSTTPTPKLISTFTRQMSSSRFPSSSSSFSPETLGLGQEEDPRCYEDAILTNFCTVPDEMTDLSFWDLYSVIFSDTILEALTAGCSKGAWCLQDRFDYWDAQIVERVDMVMKSEIASNMCMPEMTSCFDKVTNFYDQCSVSAQIQFTKEAIELVCHLKENKDLTEGCFKQTLVSLHVTVADIIRENDEYEREDTDYKDTCESAEVQMVKGLICMENSCPGEVEVFRQFQPWQWFTTVVGDLTAECGLDPTKCINVLQVGDHSAFVPSTSSVTSWPSSTFSSQLFSSNWFWTSSSSRASSTDSMMTASFSPTSYNQARPAQPITDQMIAKEINVMVGISIGVTVLAVLMVVLGCTLYKRHRRNAVVKDGYQKLLSDGDES